MTNFICACCGPMMCPTCMRNFFMSEARPLPVSKWKNSDAFIKRIDEEWDAETSDER